MKRGILQVTLHQDQEVSINSHGQVYLNYPSLFPVGQEQSRINCITVRRYGHFE